MKCGYYNLLAYHTWHLQFVQTVHFLLFSSPVLQALKDQVIKECVVGPRHVAFLLEV